MMDLNAESFNAWRHDPRTRDVFKYLTDLRMMLMEQWARGAELSIAKQEQAIAYGEMVELEWRDIEKFYGEEDEQG